MADDSGIVEALRRAWASSLEKDDAEYVGILSVDVRERTAMLHPTDEEQPAVRYRKVSEDVRSKILRTLAGELDASGRASVPVVRVKAECGVLTWVGIPISDSLERTVPPLRDLLDDLSYDASLSWKAAETAVRAIRKIQTSPDEKLTYTGQLQPLYKEIETTLSDAERELDVAELAYDPAYIIALRTEAILRALNSFFEWSRAVQHFRKEVNICNLYLLYYNRKRRIAMLEGDVESVAKADDAIEEEEEILSEYKAELRRSEFNTALALA